MPFVTNLFSKFFADVETVKLRHCTCRDRRSCHHHCEFHKHSEHDRRGHHPGCDWYGEEDSYEEDWGYEYDYSAYECRFHVGESCSFRRTLCGKVICTRTKCVCETCTYTHTCSFHVDVKCTFRRSHCGKVICTKTKCVCEVCERYSCKIHIDGSCTLRRSYCGKIICTRTKCVCEVCEGWSCKIHVDRSCTFKRTVCGKVICSRTKCICEECRVEYKCSFHEHETCTFRRSWCGKVICARTKCVCTVCVRYHSHSRSSNAIGGIIRGGEHHGGKRVRFAADCGCGCEGASGFPERSAVVRTRIVDDGDCVTKTKVVERIEDCGEREPRFGRSASETRAALGTIERRAIAGAAVRGPPRRIVRRIEGGGRELVRVGGQEFGIRMV